MLPCDHCQNLILDHLYGLLDEAEARAVEEHLQACPACAEARDKARGWSDLLARAARSDFPEVKFAAPSEPVAAPAQAPAAPQTPVPAPMPARTSPQAARPKSNGKRGPKPLPPATVRATWTRWAVAAGILLLVAGLGGPLARTTLGWWNQSQIAAEAQENYAQAKQKHEDFVARHKARGEQVQNEHQAALAQQAEVLKGWEDAWQKAQDAIERKRFFVRVEGPETIQPGAPNEYRIQTLDRSNHYTPMSVDVVVRDQNDRVVYQESKPKAPEPPMLRLPVEVWKDLKPESQLFLEVTAREDGNPEPSKLHAKVKLGAPVFVTHLATDKPMYKPGDRVYFRSLTLDRASFQPPASDVELQFRITGPDGQVIFKQNGTARLEQRSADGKVLKPLLGPDGKPLRGIGCGEFAIPSTAPGGEYTLTVSEVTRTPAEKVTDLEKRRFLVNVYKPEKFIKKLEFDGKSYGAGDVVMARCEATLAQGGALQNRPVQVRAVVEGKEVPVQSPGRTDDKGVINVRFTLPKDVHKGEGSLTVTFSDGSDSEPIVRPIPIVGRVLKVEFYPEGGDLVANVPGRVYFQVRNPFGKPADLKGYVTDGTKVVARVQTLTDPEHPGVNQGLGVFEFTPEPGKRYALHVEKPINIDEPAHNADGAALGGLAYSRMPAAGFALPQAKADGVVLTIPDGVTAPGDPLRVRVQTGTKKRSLLVGAYVRGRLLAHQRVVAEPGKVAEVNLNPEAGIGGVARVTVFEEPGDAAEGRQQVKPVAERLVYRRPAEQVIVNAQPNKQRYFPGSPVELELSALNEKEQPVPAVLMVAVVNQSVIGMADEKTFRTMPTHFLLASEVKQPEDLEFADFLLNDDPKVVGKATKALDLLLGTQGWRRFAEQNPQQFQKKHPAEADRLLVANGQKSRAPIDTYRLEEKRVTDEFRPRYEHALDRLDVAEQELMAFRSDRTPDQRLFDLARDRESTGQQYQDATRELAAYEADLRRYRDWALPVVCVLLMGLAVSGLLMGIARQGKRRSATAYYATGLVSFGLCAVALIGVALTYGTGDRAFHVADSRGANYGKTSAATPGAAMPAPAPMGGFGGMGADVMAPDAANGAEVKMPAFGPEGGPGGIGGGGPPRFGMPGGPVPGQPRFEPVMLPAGPGGFPPPPGPQGVVPVAPVPGPVPPPNMPLEAPKFDPAAAGFDRAGKGDNPDAKKQLQAGGRGEGRFGADKAKGAFRGGEQARPMDQLREAQAARRQRFNLAAEGLARKDMNRMPVGGPLAPGAGAMPNRPGLPARDLRQRAFALQLEQVIRPAEPFVVREYAHPTKLAAGHDDVRDDFTETVFWHPAIVLPSDGKTKVTFGLSSEITRYQVLVAAHTLDGRIGALTSSIEARKPFSVDPKLPNEITASDRIDIPVRLVNDSDVRRAVTFKVTPSGLKPENSLLPEGAKLENLLLTHRLMLEPNQRTRKVYSYRASVIEGRAALKVEGDSDPFAPRDAIERSLTVVPEGFPVNGFHSDLLEKVAHPELVLPAVIPGTLKVSVNVYPSTLADLQKGLDGLLREPNGCFEQTSTSNYPNLLILDYLKASDQSKPEVARRAKDLLDRGYQKLTSFECPDSGLERASKPYTRQGFEWFGGKDRQHEALTAYGLMQFKDMARVRDVDPTLIKRTQDFLMSARDGNGGFKRNAVALDTFGRAPQHITNAYIVWALTESDRENKDGMDLSKELAALKKEAKDSKDPYFLALVANSLLNRGEQEAAVEVLKKVGGMQSKEGVVEGATTSITCSGGRDLQIETTALAVLAWLKANRLDLFSANLNGNKAEGRVGAVQWIGKQRGGYGGFGSTQSTILALKALIEYTKANKRPAEAGEIRLLVGDKVVAKKAFTQQDQDAITLEVEKPEEIFKPGKNDNVRVEITTKAAYPFTLAWSGRTLKPVANDQCALRLATKLDRNQAAEGETVRLGVSLENTLDKGHGMAVSILGLPAGARLPADMKQLTKLREEGAISFFEVKGRELVLYWRELAPKQKIDLNIDLICEVPGEYRGPASRAYLYYNADHKHWVDPLSIAIAPAAEEAVSK